MKCPRCQAENREGVRFCEECGARLELTCPSCGAGIVPGKKFCGSCGAPLAAEPAARFSSPQSYTPRHLAEKILTSRSALEGERKQVTVFFADLKGSMELLADRDPEEARKLLDPVLERMMEAVHRYEGTVNQVMGDGIMALFGAPLAHEDHAVRACYAALRLQESVKQYAEEVRRSHGVTVQIRVGLNSGEVVVRSIGSDLKMDYTAVGQTTHLAARMEQLASPGSVLLTPATLRLAEGYIGVKPLGPVPVKGLAGPVEVYELTGAGVARSRLQALVVRGLTKFVGRAAEIDQLGRALERAGAGHGQVVALVGEPGVGKSRLFYEFTRSHRVQGWLLVASGSVSYGKATPYLPVIDLLKGYFQIESGDEQRKIREKVTGKLLTLDRALEPSLPAFLTLLDVPVEDAQWQALDPPQRRQRILDAVKRLLLRESQVQPLLLVFEDLHWIDSETQAFLDSLLESLPTTRILLLVNYRPEYQHGWGSKTYYSQLRLDPLGPENAEELLQALLGSDGSLQPLKQLLIQRTEGNPFFLEESVRTLVETQVLVGERGAYRLTRPIGSVQVPATVQAVLAPRIDRLPEQEKRLLQYAAAIGKNVPFFLLQSTAALPEDELRRGLTYLQSAELLYETRLFPDIEYTFKHALTQEVAYQSLPLEKRREQHERIARALEASMKGRLDEVLELLAHHYEQTGNTEKALLYLTRSAQKAADRFATQEASRYCKRAIACLDRLPPTPERDRQRIDLDLVQAETLWVLGRYEEGWRILEELRAIAERLRELERLAEIHFKCGWYLYDRMELDRAFAHHQECFALCERLDRLEQMRQVYWGLGNSCRAISADVRVRRTHAIEFHRKGLALSEVSPSRTFWDVHIAHFLWRIHLFELGDWDTAVAYLQQAERFAKELPEGSDVLHLALMKGSIGFSHLLKRTTESYLDMLRESLNAAERVGSHIYTSISQYLLGQGYFLVEDFSRALAHFQATLDIALESHNPHLPGALLWTAETAARLGQHDEALDHLRAYEALVEKAGSLEGLAWFPSRGVCHRVYGIVFARRGDAANAAQQFEQSIETLSEHGYRPDLARSYVARGEFQRDQGRLAEARDSIEKAASEFREMGFTLEQRRALELLETLSRA